MSCIRGRFDQAFYETLVTGYNGIILKGNAMSRAPGKSGETKTEVKVVEKIVEVDRVMDSVQIAQVAHEVNRAYCQALGDDSQLPWGEAPKWQAKSAILGVAFHRNNLTAGPEASHKSWLAEKIKEGWVYGEVKDPKAKTHPCVIPFEDLPVEQQAKDYIFRAIVHALIPKIVAPGMTKESIDKAAEALTELDFSKVESEVTEPEPSATVAPTPAEDL